MTVSREVLQRLKKRADTIRKETPMFVLIWGPGPRSANTPAYQKRIRIRETLEDLVGKGKAILSEELSSKDMDLLTFEYIQAEEADAIIVIPESPGPIAESALFRRLIKEKGLIFVSPQNQGFVGEIFKDLQFEEIEPDEWETCERTRRRAKEFVLRCLVEKREALVSAKRFN